MELLVTRFMDANFYNVSPLITGFERIETKELQLQGVDIRLAIPTRKVQLSDIDEKAAVRYINKDLQTFSFELSFVSPKGIRRSGWLIDPHKTTKYYALMWLKATTSPIKLISQITEVEWLLISRKIVKELLNTMGQFEEYMKILADNPSRKVIKPTPDHPFFMLISQQLTEQPINIIVKKGWLINNSVYHKIIKPI